jgi:NAD(P)-dependent dehydrogenase (short-subunit alcohol dehydrogenase family)
MLLDGKIAVVYGAAGPVGTAVARAYAREGAVVHLAGRTPATLDPLADAIRLDGGTAYAAPVDVLDQAAMEQHVAEIVETSGSIDICFNATSNDDIQGTNLVEMTLADFLQPVTKAATTHFIIGTTVGRRMIRQRGGVILVMAGGREAIPRLGGAHVAWTTLTGLCRQLAADLGPHGVRVNWLLSPGSPGSTPDPDSGEASGGLVPRHQPSYAEVGNIAVFAASDWARTMTATEINFTGGAVVD